MHLVHYNQESATQDSSPFAIVQDLQPKPAEHEHDETDGHGEEKKVSERDLQ